jgi:hypothetical protein
MIALEQGGIQDEMLLPLLLLVVMSLLDQLNPDLT